LFHLLHYGSKNGLQRAKHNDCSKIGQYSFDGQDMMTTSDYQILKTFINNDMIKHLKNGLRSLKKHSMKCGFKLHNDLIRKH